MIIYFSTFGYCLKTTLISTQIRFTLSFCIELFSELPEAPFRYGSSGTFHQVQIIMEVVIGIEPCRKDLAAAEEVPQIGPAEGATHITAALRINRRIVVQIFPALDVQPPSRSKQHPVPCVSGRHDTVEHIVAGIDPLDQILGSTDPHDISRLVGRKERRRETHHLQHPVLLLTDRDPSKSIAVK